MNGPLEYSPASIMAFSFADFAGGIYAVSCSQAALSPASGLTTDFDLNPRAVFSLFDTGDRAYPMTTFLLNITGLVKALALLFATVLLNAHPTVTAWSTSHLTVVDNLRDQFLSNVVADLLSIRTDSTITDSSPVAAFSLFLVLPCTFPTTVIPRETVNGRSLETASVVSTGTVLSEANLLMSTTELTDTKFPVTFERTLHLLGFSTRTMLVTIANMKHRVVEALGDTTINVGLPRNATHRPNNSSALAFSSFGGRVWTFGNSIIPKGKEKQNT